MFDLDVNKNQFLSILNNLSRSDCNIPGLVDKLESSDFFYAPATPNAFGNFAGGLCRHALYRYQELENLVKLYDFTGVKEIEKDSVIITGLLADLNKMDYYEEITRNKQFYTPDGRYTDSRGKKFNWVQETSYKVKDAEDRYIYGTSGETAERIITGYLALKEDESIAIMQLRTEYENPHFNLASIYMRCPLAVLLNCADKIASFIDTRSDIIPF